MDPEKRRKYRKERYHTNRALLVSELGGKCVRCGSTSNLEFDHVDPADKSFDLSKNFCLSLNRLREEAKKCQLLCKPCHISKSLEEGDYRSAPTWNHGTLYGGRTMGCGCSLCIERVSLHNAERRRKRSTTCSSVG